MKSQQTLISNINIQYQTLFDNRIELAKSTLTTVDDFGQLLILRTSTRKNFPRAFSISVGGHCPDTSIIRVAFGDSGDDAFGARR